MLMYVVYVAAMSRCCHIGPYCWGADGCCQAVLWSQRLWSSGAVPGESNTAGQQTVVTL